MRAYYQVGASVQCTETVVSGWVVSIFLLAPLACVWSRLLLGSSWNPRLSFCSAPATLVRRPGTALARQNRRPSAQPPTPFRLLKGCRFEFTLFSSTCHSHAAAIEKHANHDGFSVKTISCDNFLRDYLSSSFCLLFSFLCIYLLLLLSFSEQPRELCEYKIFLQKRIHPKELKRWNHCESRNQKSWHSMNAGWPHSSS